MEQSIGEKISEALAHPFVTALQAEGITIESLAKELSKELKANETKVIKVKGGLPAPELTPTGRPKKGSYRTLIKNLMGDSVIAVDMVNWSVRQAARMDAQKLLDLYPAKQVKLSGPGPGGSIPITNFPPTAKSIDEWQQQMEEAERKRMERQSAAPAPSEGGEP
ncbi:MAG: hypothetical protein LLG06_19690 [Desulfobacteraceae bacterium]|nr:hypothetical protein [Desulfobacteraceae bacterium]